MTENILLHALEPEGRIEILKCLRSDTLTTILGYSATKVDAARAISQQDALCGAIEIQVTYHEPYG